ncbi:hypothetical protein [Chitinophaga rhizosphaerae]|uniref:hypothetical protein n=1 Tax=Chitinophaga rhizosphaerae TaxID=1864947 RepID=UPI000F808F80|nr:hypothetical protein [Chitinophaga rhizosphaerae]
MLTETELFEQLYRSMKETGGPNLVIHAENESFGLVSIFEAAYLLDVNARKAILIDSFYGNPTCGVLTENGDWAAVGGNDGLAVIRNGAVTRYHGVGVYDMRQSGPESLLILEDPWMEDAAIWEFNVRTALLEKVRPFPDYARQPYTENVIW